MLDSTLQISCSEMALPGGGGIDDVLTEAHREGHLSRTQRESIYELLRLTPAQIRDVEGMVAAAPGRMPGRGALNNLVTLFPSRKNQASRWLESHTVERLYAYRLERDPDVIGYVTQVPCTRITRIRNGKKHVTSAHMDFLVFRRDGIFLVECKDEETLKGAVSTDDEWQFEDGCWNNSVYQEFAHSLGIRFSVYARSRLFGIELQNEEYIYAAAWGRDEEKDELIGRRVERAIRETPHTIDQLTACVPGFTIRHAARLIASGRAHGMERVLSLDDTDGFYLFSQSEHRDLVVEQLKSDQLKQTSDLEIEDRLLLAPEKYVLFAKKRLSRLEAIADGREPRTRRMDDLADTVASKVAEGMRPLEACLPDYQNCGSNGAKITDDQKTEVQAIAARWKNGEFSTRIDGWIELDALCKKKGIQPPHQSTLNRSIRETDSLKRTLRTIGLRAYQKDKPRTDGTRCSLPSLAYGHTLVIDSSQFDQRVAANLLTLFPSAVPRFYAGIDGATGKGMAQALVFGAARTDGLAILLRDYVHQHGFLPRCIQLDRGSENRAGWTIEFCTYFCIELRWAPTGGSRCNGLAENVIGRVNHSVAHCGPGSTWPDQMGRGADGRVKSRKTAVKVFAEICSAFKKYMLVELNATRRIDDLSPDDLVVYCEEAFGAGGRPCLFDDAFLIWTSIEVREPEKIILSRGVRLTEGAYAGTSLASALKKGHVDRIRKDCINPSLIFVRCNGGWHKAYRRDAQIWLSKSWSAQLFKTLSEPSERSNRSQHNLELKIARRDADMREAMAGKEALTSVESKQDQTPVVEKPQFSYPDINWDEIAS